MLPNTTLASDCTSSHFHREQLSLSPLETVSLNVILSSIENLTLSANNTNSKLALILTLLMTTYLLQNTKVKFIKFDLLIGQSATQVKITCYCIGWTTAQTIKNFANPLRVDYVATRLSQDDDFYAHPLHSFAIRSATISDNLSRP